MKKIVSLILVLVLVFAMSVPAIAENETGGTSVITYSVAPNYTITIPSAGVTITGASVTADVKVNTGSLIDANKHLEFSISGAANYDLTEGAGNVGFRLVNGSLNTVFLHYTISCEGHTDIVKDTVFLSATAAEVNAGKSVTLTFTPDEATQAGTYTDTITFTVNTVNNITP